MTYLIARGTEPRRVTSRILERELTQKWMRATLRRRGPQVEENQQERTDHGCPQDETIQHRHRCTRPGALPNVHGFPVGMIDGLAVCDSRMWLRARISCHFVGLQRWRCCNNLCHCDAFRMRWG